MSTNFILCEGVTDQILISYYLIHQSGWTYFKLNHNKKNINIAHINDSAIEWYSRGDNYLGIWPVGGNNFSKQLETIIARCSLGNNSIKKLVVITDHDNEEAETKRPESLNAVVSGCLGKKIYPFSSGEWKKSSIIDDFTIKSDLETLYLLVPTSGNGALETFVLEAISENNTYAKEVIEQVRLFIKYFHSDKYLTHQREKIKAELSVSISIFSPDKAFHTMDEYLKSIHWEDYKEFNIQFQELEKI